ncbi:MAG: ABC transporter ATP-binding protein [Longimicrobiales bacterium]
MSFFEVRNLRTHLQTPDGVARAVDGVDLAVREGEAVGVVGESGSGKSVLALSILGLLPGGKAEILEGSSIRLRGEELVGLEGEALRRIRGKEIAMVFQEPMTSLNPVFTVGSQIREALVLHRGMGRGSAEEEGVRLLREVGIPEAETRMKAYPHQLSGGMRQRAMIAIALAGEPSLLVADEPTTALDVTIQAQILGLLRKLKEDRGMALLLISHDLRVVAQVCTTVFVMYGGRVVERGSAVEVFHRPKHPYTRGLLGSRLSVRDRRARLRPVPGDVPEATAWPAGCRFHPRCRDAVAECRSEEPPMVSLALDEVGGGFPVPGKPEVRGASCWFPSHGGGEGG